MYRRNAALLPDEVSSDDFKGRMIANYPFHPTLVDFLNKKLASIGFIIAPSAPAVPEVTVGSLR